jgi:hypothetical protein
MTALEGIGIGLSRLLNGVQRLLSSCFKWKTWLWNSPIKIRIVLWLPAHLSPIRAYTSTFPHESIVYSDWQIHHPYHFSFYLYIPSECGFNSRGNILFSAVALWPSRQWLLQFMISILFIYQPSHVFSSSKSTKSSATIHSFLELENSGHIPICDGDTHQLSVFPYFQSAPTFLVNGRRSCWYKFQRFCTRTHLTRT